jgi:hypothetical protein
MALNRSSQRYRRIYFMLRRKSVNDSDKKPANKKRGEA